MDLQNFYVDSKRRISSQFRLLRSAAESSQKMSTPLQFAGVSMSDAFLEEHCLAHLQNMAQNTHLSFQEMAKNGGGGPKKQYFDQYNRFPTITFSKLVGGFVGSKSHGGASRESHQVWDVILRQVVDTTSQGSLRNNLLDCINCINMEKTMSSTLFVPFCQKHGSTLDASLAYLLANNCGIFDGKKTPYSAEPQQGCSNITTHPQEKPCHLELSSTSSESAKENSCEKSQVVPRQSYADVARAFAAKRNEGSCVIKDTKRSGTSPLFLKSVKVSESGNMRTKCSKKDLSDLSSYVNSPLCSSRNNYDKRLSQNMEKSLKAKRANFCREISRHPFRSYLDKNRPYELQQHCIPGKSKRHFEDRRPRSYKYKNYNMKEKEKKTLGQQVQEDVSFICNNSELNCKNWRCRHNRVKSVPSNSIESQVSTEQRRVNETVNENKVPSASSYADKINLKSTEQSPVTESNIRSQCVEDLKHSDAVSHLSSFPQTSGGSMGDLCSESSFSSGSSASANSQPERCRVTSECSVDSEDSIVFESDDCEAPQVDLNHEESDAESDCSTDSETFEAEDSDCDEVDFCQLLVTSGAVDNPEHYVSEWLQNVNNKWDMENAMIPRKEKEPKKVRFAENKDLVKVHLLVKWDYAYRSARVGPWEEIGRDRSRFRARIIRTECVLAPILDPEHRRKVWEERERRSAVK